jgi:hypothetical protein
MDPEAEIPQIDAEKAKETLKAPPFDPHGPVHFIFDEAINPELNGEFRFRYPGNDLLMVIGARKMQLANAGLPVPIQFDLFPMDVQMRAEAIATLEYVIAKAPAGWYTQPKNPQLTAPRLDLTSIGDGDENVVLTVFRKGYLEFRERFRAALREQ